MSYGGDDWGDEYDDEYDAAPPPQEMAKPTGYRQPGQGVGGLQQPAGNYTDGRKPYGDLQSGPQMGADRSATLPHQLRRNSFGEDDERRAFSSGTTQFPPQSGPGAPQLYVQTQQPQQQNMGGFRGPGPQPMQTPPIQGPGAFPETPYSVHESQRSYMGEQSQQYFQQPYQQTQPVSPVNARGIPVQPAAYGRNASPVSAGRSGSAGNFAPRKSSLSHGSASEMGYGSHSRERSQEPVMKPWPGPGVASPGGTAPPAPKALPFVRPADIYRRLEEERTKERQSIESGRPSMDSIGDRGREMLPPAAPPSSAISPPQDQYTRGRSGSQSDTYGVTDSGRRLGQSLEPVAERKSEYSFMETSTRSPEVAQKLENIKRTESPHQPSSAAPSSGAPIYNVVEQFSTVKPPADPQGPQESVKQPYTAQYSNDAEHDSSFEAEEHRRFSTSPKLPDLNRLSGFGFDMWGVKPSEPEPAPVQEPARPVVAPVQPPTNPVEHTLRQEPSLGFNSVVHQAFDRNDSFSDARDPQRTDSETSVGTSDISPIVPRAAFISDDQATPMITEESEPNSRRGSGHITPKQEFRPETPPQHASFLPGHRRDLSAPIDARSRDNSPARTPVVRQSAVVGPGVQVHIAETSPSPEEERQIDDAARYERYPRPPIPGGWQSYATIGSESIHRPDEPNVPADTSKIAPYTAQIIASNPLPDEFSPTIAAKTEQIRPPSPEVTPVIQPPAPDEHSPFIARQMENMAPPSPAVEHAPDTRAPDAFSPSLAREMDIIALPTPDPHMGPMGNPYSQAAMDPRIDGRHSQPETPLSSKSADTITGLAPPTINEQGISPGSSVGPTPPPKDTPGVAGFGQEGYFPPPVPLKPKTAEEVAATEGLVPPTRPVMMTNLSTMTMPSDDENDKLRKEIVKSLSPRPSVSGPSTQAQRQPDQSMLGVASSSAPRESTYLPSEYDSYWGANDDEPSQYHQPEFAPVKPQPHHDVTVNIEAASPSSEKSATPPIPPLNPKRVSRTSMSSIPGINHSPRYSFDQGQERRLSTDNRSDTSTPAVVGAPVPETKPWIPSLAGNGSAKGRLPVDLQRADSASPAPLSIRSTKTDRASEVSSEKPKDEESPAQGILGMAVAAGAAVAATLLPIGAPSAVQDDQPKDVEKDDVDDVPSSQGIVVDEDDRINDKALSAEVSPVSAMSPTHDIPAMMNVVSPPSGAAHQPQSSMSQSAMLPSPLNISRPTTAQPNSPHPQNAANQPPPMEFREIMVMPAPEQRIEAYNKAREQYATMDSGLSGWLAAQTGQPGPHTPPQGLDGGRSRAGSVAQGGPAPYYQQSPYANASSPADSTPVSNMGTPQRQSTLGAMGLGTQSGFGGGRSTSHQAQQQAQIAKEKGKELLHSAGMFGGAVGKKGKGLFKKGTSRWLGGGSGDKVE